MFKKRVIELSSSYAIILAIDMVPMYAGFNIVILSCLGNFTLKSLLKLYVDFVVYVISSIVSSTSVICFSSISLNVL